MLTYFYAHEVIERDALFYASHNNCEEQDLDLV